MKHEIDILCIQETWLLQSKADRLSISSDYQFHSKCGIDERQSIMQGHPYVGIAVMWHDSMSKHIWPVEYDRRRVCAIKVSMNGMNTIVASVHMPCDNQLMQECNN